ncbi:porin [Paucibacter sp. R3-3]|uniref:Porin n=1 Tax=Roseateles agri TaxID=3098619 RepID=A0ABU5DP24_9BURK|nr:porin [Paucibacter sp. R3-3]MDY0748067.1 porin [Paucibacter sp. R3-3]
MKQILGALALALPMVPALAQSSVTIYGVLDLSVGATNNGNGNVKQLMSGVGPGSRLGFRGTEDLGGGLKANFVLEEGIAVDTGTLNQGGLAWGRQIFVGLSSTWWSLSAGRQYSPLNVSLVESDAFRQVYWGDTTGTGNALYQSPGAAQGSGGQASTARVNNSVLATATGGGFTGRLMVAAGDEGNNGSGHLAMLGGTYRVGGLLLTGTYNRFRQYATTLAAGTSPQWQTEFNVGGSYDFGPVMLLAGYYSYDPSENRTPGAPTALDPRFTKTVSDWIGFRAPLGGGTLIGQVMKTTFDYAAADGRGTTIAAAYEYPLSKRTTLYGSYAQLNNNAQGLVSIQGATVSVFPAYPGADLRGYAFGLRHTF